MNFNYWIEKTGQLVANLPASTKEVFMDFIKRFKGWLRILQILVSSFVNIIANPSFIMFSLIGIGLGTMGIWIPFSPFIGHQESVVNSLDNMSVFTFCIATLGNMATEYFFENKSEEASGLGIEIQNDDEYKSILSRHAAFFSWSSALLLSFLCLVDDYYLLYGLGSTLALWLLVNINRPKFRAINSAAMNNLSPELKNDGSRVGDDDFGGSGL